MPSSGSDVYVSLIYYDLSQSNFAEIDCSLDRTVESYDVEFLATGRGGVSFRMPTRTCEKRVRALNNCLDGGGC